MAMKQRDHTKPRRRKPHKGWYRLRRPQNGPETTLQYTAQEIHEMAHHQRRAGIIRPDTGDLDVSAAFVERGGGQQTKRPPLVILVIIILALVFIGIITYFVAHMPPKT